jgi:hypothetical protein
LSESDCSYANRFFIACNSTVHTTFFVGKNS